MKKPMIVAGLAFVLFIISHILFRSPPQNAPIIIAHRGGMGLAPENTLLALQKAEETGVTYFELDIQRTKDDILILMHDPWLNRTTTGSGSIRSENWDTIKQYHVDLTVDGQAFKLPIPQLQDVLQYAKEQELNLVLEIKNPRLYPEIANQVVELIVENEMQEQVIIIAFNAGSLKEVAQKYDEITLGYLQIYPLKIPKYPASKVVSVYWLSIMLDPTLIMRLHKQDFHVWIWTVDSKWLAKIALWKGVDGITTNQPDKRGSWGVP